jgi:hypothetical protein
MTIKNTSRDFIFTYTAIEFAKKVEMANNKIEIPEGNEVQSLEDLVSMGL